MSQNCLYQIIGQQTTWLVLLFQGEKPRNPRPVVRSPDHRMWCHEVIRKLRRQATDLALVLVSNTTHIIPVSMKIMVYMLIYIYIYRLYLYIYICLITLNCVVIMFDNSASQLVVFFILGTRRDVLYDEQSCCEVLCWVHDESFWTARENQDLEKVCWPLRRLLGGITVLELPSSPSRSAWNRVTFFWWRTKWWSAGRIAIFLYQASAGLTQLYPTVRYGMFQCHAQLLQKGVLCWF